MLYALICTDRRGAIDLRLETRPEHVAYLDGLGGALKFAGPFLDEDGQPEGSLIVVAAGDRIAAETIAANDPYAKAGLFQSVDIRAWKWAIKNPES